MKEKCPEYILFLCGNICVSLSWLKWPRYAQSVIILVRDVCEWQTLWKAALCELTYWCVPTLGPERAMGTPEQLLPKSNKKPKAQKALMDFYHKMMISSFNKLFLFHLLCNTTIT